MPEPRITSYRAVLISPTPPDPPIISHAVYEQNIENWAQKVLSKIAPKERKKSSIIVFRVEETYHKTITYIPKPGDPVEP